MGMGPISSHTMNRTCGRPRFGVLTASGPASSTRRNSMPFHPSVRDRVRSDCERACHHSRWRNADAHSTAAPGQVSHLLLEFIFVDFSARIALLDNLRGCLAVRIVRAPPQRPEHRGYSGNHQHPDQEHEQGTKTHSPAGKAPVIHHSHHPLACSCRGIPASHRAWTLSRFRIRSGPGDRCCRHARVARTVPIAARRRRSRRRHPTPCR